MLVQQIRLFGPRGVRDYGARNCRVETGFHQTGGNFGIVNARHVDRERRIGCNFAPAQTFYTRAARETS